MNTSIKFTSCAHRRVVTSEALSSKIAHLETEIMPQSWPAQSKNGFWDLSASKKSQTVLFSKPIVLAGAANSTNLGEKSIFPRFLAYQSLGDQMLSGWEAYMPQASTAR